MSPDVPPPLYGVEARRIHRLHVYYGFGKGKTTAAIGLAIRMLGAGGRVAFVQFDKGYDGQTEHYAARHVLRRLEGLELYPTGCERMNKDGSFRFGVEPRDVEEAQRGLAIAREQLARGTADLLVLDEVLAAVAYKLIGRDDVMALVELYDRDRRLELVLTGHKVWKELLERADLVTEMKKIKHYFDAGTPAREGIEM